MRSARSGLIGAINCGALSLAALVAVLTMGAQGLAQTAPQRIAFQIATGSTSGNYFPVGEMLAGLLSHPPGIGRCEAQDVCGPPGLIVSTRASEGSIANVIAVEHGNVDSGLAQADVVALAVEGKGPFRKMGPAKKVRVIANLYPEDVHLVASTKAHISGVSDLRHKRVSISTQGSGTISTAQAILAAYGLSEKSIKPNYDSLDRAAELLQAGKLDAVFFVGGAPVQLIDLLIRQRAAVLVPISGPGRKKLIAGNSVFAADTIPRHTYSDTPAIDTVSVGALWITNDSQSAGLIYAMTKALYNPANRRALQEANSDSRFIDLDLAAKGTAAPLHAGALHFYREKDVLPSEPGKH